MTPLLLVVVSVLLQHTSAPVAGVVIDAVTKAPVARARVVLVHPDRPLSAARLTIADDEGRFSFADVAEGSYRLFADRDDYLRGEHQGAITLAAGQRVAAISIAIVPTGVISGRVLTGFGEPASKIFVRALKGSQVVTETRTNDLGEYRLFNLPPGAYVVAAERYQGPRIEGTTYRVPTPPCPDCRGEGAFTLGLVGVLKTGGFIAPTALTNRTYPAVYFPGTTDLNAGQAIEVRPGAEVYGIDLTLVVK
jgi:hypothetical protein